jgi:predicted dehydrogenase
MRYQKTRLAVIGFGFGRQLAKAAQKSDLIDLVAVAEPDSARAKQAEREFKVPVYPDLEPLLKKEDVEGVVIVTSNDTHFPLASMAFEAGKHVFVDKPITNDPEEGREMIAISRQRGLRLAVGHNTRLFPAHRKMKQLVESGDIGKVLVAEGNFSHRGGMSLTPERWRWHRERCPGGPMMLLGVHHTDTLQHILGPVESVTAFADRLAHPAEIDDVVLSLLRFQCGALGYLGSAYAIPSVFTLNLYGTEANLYSDGGKTLRIKKNGESEPRAVPLVPVDSHVMELEGFARSIREDRQPLVTGEEGLRALQVVVASIRSADTGKAEKVES